MVDWFQFTVESDFYWRGNINDLINLTSWDANKASLAESVTGDMS